MYGDSSRFYFLCLLYILGIWKLLTYSGFYSPLLFVFSTTIQTILLLERNDFILLKKQLGIIKSYLFIFLDLFFFNSIILLCILFKSLLYPFIFSSALLILSPLLLFLKKINYYFKLPFSTIDPLWINYIRRKPWILLILIVIYFVQYQALENKNIGLFEVSSFGIGYFVFQIYREKEKLIYLKFSKKKVKIYLLESLKSNIVNTLYISIPSLLLHILYKISPIEFIFQIIFSTSIIFFIRYLFYKNDIVQGITYFISIFVLFYLQKEMTFAIYLIIVFIINILLYKLTSEKLQQIIKSYKG
ncbi:hypothetical protein D1632_16605 [Chryseobacterium nematophagum]|uniref:Uncharacterized protein n=1 Tax=Chryseobacterium nematophagum TaxID=2305228 RepID=A0A3M7L7L3_9FLAO|nr:hypothetical protein D1632_16605 [Chryseobacterium nematophagum]